MTLPNPLTGRKSKWKWSEARGQYIYKATGRAVPIKQVRNAFESVIRTSAARMEALTAQLAAGKITLAAWQLAQANHIKLVHMTTTAAARGGWSRMSPADWRYANSLMKDQLKFLKGFAKDIRSGKQKLDGSALRRARMYAEAARSSFEQMRRRNEMLNNGKTEERGKLGSADHCSSCLERAAMGWQPIGTLPPIGQSLCLTKCHCTFEFR